MNMRAIAFAALGAISTIFALGAKAQEADLGVVKSGPASAAAGSDVPYTITVSNVGPDDAATVQLNDPLPEGMSFVSMTQTGGTPFSCSTPNPGDTAGTVTCTTGLLPSGGSATFTLTLNIPAMTPPGTTFTNIATVSSQTPDPDDENNSSAAATTTPPPPQADLAVSKNGPQTAQANTDVTFTITLTNAGPSSATNVSLTDTLPGTMTFVNLTQSGATTFSCSTPASGSGGTITCTAGSMPANTTVTFQLTGHVPPGTASGTTFTNTATVTSDEDPDDENNTGTTGFTISSSDIGIVKSGPAMATSGTDLPYTITVTNNGPDFAQSAQFSDPLPAGVTFVSIQQVSGTATSTCATPAPGSTGTVTCSVFGINPTQGAQFTLTVHVGTTDPIPAQITNVATLSPNPSDANATNDSSMTTTAIVNQADVSITKNGPATVTAGMDANYTIVIANGGPSAAYNVTLNDTMPANTTFGSLTAPAGWSCTTPPAGGTGAISCTAARLDPNAQASFTLVLHVAPNTPSGAMLTNGASVSTATDSTPLNNTATSTATVQTSADVQLTKSGPSAAGSATNVVYTVIVTNAGPSDAQNVTMTDAVPSGATFVSLSQSGPPFNCTAPAPGATGTVTCTIGTLTSGASTTFTITVTTPPSTTTTLSNTANVTSTTSDPNPLNNTATTSTAVSPNPADLSITKTANAPAGTLPNAPLTYTLTVANLGPSTANGVSVTDVLPANTTYASASSTQGSCTGTTTVVCTLGTMTSGATATITINVIVGPALGPIVNTATVASTNVDPDPNPANNTSTVTVNVVPTIPTLSPLSLALLALALGVCGLFVTKVRG